MKGAGIGKPAVSPNLAYECGVLLEGGERGAGYEDGRHDYNTYIPLHLYYVYLLTFQGRLHITRVIGLFAQ